MAVLWQKVAHPAGYSAVSVRQRSVHHMSVEGAHGNLRLVSAH